jgi:hypothetical protein
MPREPQGPDEEGADKIIRVAPKGSQVETVLRGPRVSREGFAEVPLSSTLGGRPLGHRLSSDKELGLTLRSWTPWVEVEFKVGLFRRVWGMCRFYPLHLEPGKFELYVTPIHIDPGHACFRLSAPDDYGASLASSLGLYAILGIPEDTKAVTEHHMDEDFAMCWDIIGEQKQMLLHELEDFRRGYSVLSSSRQTAYNISSGPLAIRPIRPTMPATPAVTARLRPHGRDPGQGGCPGQRKNHADRVL